MVRYFEDLAVGDTYEFGSYTVTKAKILEFAREFDPQPFHVDEEAARESIFGGLVASGLHTLSLSVRLFVTEFVQGNEGLANMGGLGMDDVRWHEPVRPGDTLGVRLGILEKTPSESRSDRGYVKWSRTVFNDDGEDVLTNVFTTIVERDPAGRDDRPESI